jgi:hypothetical protein
MTATPISAIGDHLRIRPIGSRRATSIATTPRAAQTSCCTPGAHADWSSSAASIEDAENTMTRPMARSSPADPRTRWQLVIGPSSQAGPWKRGGRSWRVGVARSRAVRSTADGRGRVVAVIGTRPARPPS